MSAELAELINDLPDQAATQLMALVKDDLESGRVDERLAALSPDEANEFLAIVDRAVSDFPKIIDSETCGDLARRFLAGLAALSPLEQTIADRLIDGGVRFGVADFVAWAKQSLNLAALLGIRFQYELQTVEHAKTKDGTIETHRIIRGSIGSPPNERDET